LYLNILDVLWIKTFQDYYPFTEDTVIYEPFSKPEDIPGKTTGLHGRQSIEPFLGVVVMANEGLEGKSQ
jgi:hypothetical protein